MDMQTYYRSLHKKCVELDPETEQAWQQALLVDPSEKWIPMFRRSQKAIALMNSRNEERDYVGCLSLTNAFVAAELLIAGTHRLATDQEIQAYETESARKRQEILAEDQARQSKGTAVSISPEALRKAIANLGIETE